MHIHLFQNLLLGFFKDYLVMMMILFKRKFDLNYPFYHFTCQIQTPNQISNHCKYFCCCQNCRRLADSTQLSESSATAYIKHCLCLSFTRREVAKSFEFLDLEFQDDFQVDPGSLPCQHGNGRLVDKWVSKKPQFELFHQERLHEDLL